MRFFSGSLTKRQRVLLITSQERAKHHWGCTILKARRLVEDKDLFTASTVYKRALEAADILLDIDADSARAQQRFSTTATEYAYISASINQRRNIGMLRRKMIHRFRFLHLYHHENDLVRGVEVALSADKEAVKRWVDRFERCRSVAMYAGQDQTVVHLADCHA